MGVGLAHEVKTGNVLAQHVVLLLSSQPAGQVTVASPRAQLGSHCSPTQLSTGSYGITGQREGEEPHGRVRYGPAGTKRQQVGQGGLRARLI